MKRENQYPRTVFWSEEDQGYIGIVPDLPGCSAFGDTEEEVLIEIKDAIDAWIEATNAAGNVIPEPSVPKPEPQASGKTLLRMPRSLHQSLIEEAKHEGVSLNQYLVHVLSSRRGLASDEVSKSDVKSTFEKVLSKIAFTKSEQGQAVDLTTWIMAPEVKPSNYYQQFYRPLLSSVFEQASASDNNNTSDDTMIVFVAGGSPWHIREEKNG